MSVVCYAQEQDIAESFGMYSKGIDYYHKGKLYDAKETLEQAVRLDPRNDEAQGYLDLVNAEIRMREKGKLDFYQGQSEFKRESTQVSTYGVEQVPPRRWNGQDEPQPEMYAGGDSDNPEEYIQEETFSNKEYKPGKISGEIRSSIGVTSEDFIWKDANGDKTGVPFEKNWRYLWGQERHNTYDKKIYDSLKVNFDTGNKTGFNLYGQIKTDPWTFVGTEDVRIDSTAGGDYADIRLKYWSGTRSTINEIYRTNKGNIINLKEIKIEHGHTTPNTPTGITDWSTAFTSIPTDTEIDWQYIPVRKLWVDYASEDKAFNGRVFLIADQAQALTSDDPLRLSNNHAYWEESPWLDEYEPSRIFYPDSGLRPVKQGRWIRRLSFFSKDSDQERLTFLRGLSMNGEAFSNSTYNMTVATPMSLWDDYENVTSIPAAFRIKSEVLPELTLGSTYAFKGGMRSDSLEAQNHVLGFDANYSVSPEWNIIAGLAGSDTEVDEANGMKTSYDGVAYSLGISSEAFKTGLKAVYMAQDFYPGLSNYRYTRRDQFYSKHIRFTELPGEDQAISVGDGIDRGRIAVNFKTEADFFDDNLNAKLNFRDVHKDNGKNVETVARLESTLKATPQVTLKALGSYQKLPKTIAGLDPLYYAKNSYAFTDYYSEDDRFMENSKVVDGKDPSIGNMGLGIRYDFTENLAWEGIYERTNDPDNNPRGLLNDSYVTTETKNGMLLDKMVPFLYDQGFFDLPPYDYYGIYKTRFIYKPFSRLTGILSFTRNEDKHAWGIDDNINHIGLELDYAHNEKLSFGFKYIYSKVIDVYRQNKGEGVHYDGHHNIFLNMNYAIDECQNFMMEFGEFVGYEPVEDLSAPAKWSLSALDTQHIVRMYYNRRF